MASSLLIAMGVMALVFVAITRRAAQPPAVTEVNPAEEEASASSAGRPRAPAPAPGPGGPGRPPPGGAAPRPAAPPHTRPGVGAPPPPAPATVPTAAAAGTVAAAIRTAVRMAMCDIFATRANWPSCEAGSTSVGLATGKVVEGETLHYLWFVSSDLTVRCYRTINPTFAFIEGDWGLTRSARMEPLTEEIGA